MATRAAATPPLIAILYESQRLHRSSRSRSCRGPRSRRAASRTQRRASQSLPSSPFRPASTTRAAVRLVGPSSSRSRRELIGGGVVSRSGRGPRAQRRRRARSRRSPRRSRRSHDSPHVRSAGKRRTRRLPARATPHGPRGRGGSRVVGSAFHAGHAHQRHAVKEADAPGREPAPALGRGCRSDEVRDRVPASRRPPGTDRPHRA